jgi:hypothetical protein
VSRIILRMRPIFCKEVLNLHSQIQNLGPPINNHGMIVSLIASYGKMHIPNINMLGQPRPAARRRHWTRAQIR